MVTLKACGVRKFDRGACGARLCVDEASESAASADPRPSSTEQATIGAGGARSTSRSGLCTPHVEDHESKRHPIGTSDTAGGLADVIESNCHPAKLVSVQSPLPEERATLGAVGQRHTSGRNRTRFWDDRLEPPNFAALISHRRLPSCVLGRGTKRLHYPRLSPIFVNRLIWAQFGWV